MFVRTVGRRLFVFACSAFALFLSWPLSASPPLVQLPGTAGCVSETGTAGACEDGVALITAMAVAVSPDGRSVYAVAGGSDALVAFDRDPSTGELTQKAGTAACTSEDGTLGACADGVAMLLPGGVAVSPDGTNVYVASSGESDAVAVFRRSLLDGEVEQAPGLAACVSDSGTMGSCTDGVGLLGARGVAVSPNGRNVYVVSISSGGGAIAIFDRDPSMGTLTQKAGLDACISDTGGACTDGVALATADAVAVSPDSRQVYVAALQGDAVAVFDRDPVDGELTQKAGTAGCVSEDGTGGACANGVALDGATGVVVSPDGRNVYVASQLSDALVVFDRNAQTGELTQKAGVAGCVSEDGTGGACADGTAMNQPSGLAVSADGRSVYFTSLSSVAVFDRDLATGELTQKAGLAGCVSDVGGGMCTDGVALVSPSSVAASAVGGHVYVALSQSNAVAAFTTAVVGYDIDGDGELDPLTDGLLLVRFLFGFTGNALINVAVDLVNCTRCTAAAIEAYIATLSSP
jgi:DNA-binding beta-propeller fold protein YncE